MKRPRGDKAAEEDGVVDHPAPRAEDESADPDDSDGGSDLDRPKKSDHRQRAHSNPLAHCYIWRPDTPAVVPLGEYYPAICGPGADGSAEGPGLVRWIDLGCGFGSLLVELAKVEHRTLTLGMEIRRKPAQFVQKRLQVLRRESRAALPANERKQPVCGDNVWAVEANSMKTMPNYFRKGQLTKIFICFPDPHFKKRNVRRRIVSPSLLAEYAFCMAVGGRVYTITDVGELTDWMVEHLSAFPLFARVPNADLANDPLVPLLLLTDEGLKVTRNNGNMFVAAFDRLAAAAVHVESPLPREVAALAAATAGYTPNPGGELRGKTW